MIKLMRGNKVIAVEEARSSKYELPYIRIAEGVTVNELPLGLFNSPSICISRVYDWAVDRIFPEERYDCKELLKELNLPSYDAISIIQKTKAYLHGADPYWIDFGMGDYMENWLRGYFKDFDKKQREPFH